MKNGRTVLEWQRPLAFLAAAPLGWVTPLGQIIHFAGGATICAGNQLAEWAFLVLSGSCGLRRDSVDKTGLETLHQYRHGETFGGFLGQDTSVIADEDSSVLRIRLRDLADLTPKLNGHRPAGLYEHSDPSRFTFTLDEPRGKMETLAFFSPALPEKFLAESIAQRLALETGASVVSVQLVTSTHEAVDGDLACGFVLPMELREVESGLRLLRIRVPEGPVNPEILGELFRNLRYRFDYVLLGMDAGKVPARVLMESIEHSKTVYCFLRPDTEDLYHLDLMLHELKPALADRGATELKSVLCLAENEAAAGFEERLEKTGLSIHSYIRGCPLSTTTRVAGKIFHADIRRLARSIGNCLVGLALSSGAAKGFSHIGVLQVLEENGIEPDVVAGSSMGAYIGAIWAYGCDGEQMEKLARNMEAKLALWRLIDPVFPPRQGFLQGNAVKRMLQQTIGDAQFSDLVRPLRVLATNLDALGRMVFSSGSVATAVHTSVAVPGIFVPVRIAGESYVDGGIVDPLPTDVLQEMGVRKIIAVNAIPSSDRLRQSLQARREFEELTTGRARKLARKFLPFNKHINYFARGNLLEILMNCIHGAQIRMAEASCLRANVVLRPDVGDDRWLDFRNPRQYIQAGRECALCHLDEIKALIEEKGVLYEHKPAPASLAAIA